MNFPFEISRKLPTNENSDAAVLAVVEAAAAVAMAAAADVVMTRMQACFPNGDRLFKRELSFL